MIATDPQDIKNLRAAGSILAGVLQDLQALAKDGVSTAELDLAAEHAIRARGAVPAFLNYMQEDSPYPFPAALCVAVNHEVVHGIPSANRFLHNGDVLSLDLGLSYNGLFVDAARTMIVGVHTDFANPAGEQSLRPSEGDPKAQKLLRATHEALEAALSVVHAGARVGDIGAAVMRVAGKYGVSVVEELGGHGLGKTPHEAPFVGNIGREGEGELLQEGEVLAIEPILTEGNGKIMLEKDQWTISTKDKKRAAHFEDTVIVTKSGVEVLTRM